jgi:hypothetical protein
MNDDNHQNNNKEISLLRSDETVQLVIDDLPAETDRIKSNMLTHKTLTQHRLMRWCAIILALSALIIIWRYITILILSLWLSSICRPILEWLVNHL